MNAAAIRNARARLLAWYDSHRRDLPWRTAPGEAPDPYRVWLSEVMLQQTQVETVRPYFERWIERFPDVESLAAAEHDDVMKAWEGLGYYSRARNLHRAVREVAETWSGRVPDEPGTFRALPGVGRYTAGAVMSIAFGRPEPVVDGNVRRVFARWTDDPAPADASLWALAEAMVAGERPGDLNQALMELGATVCTPRKPACATCPVASHCLARAAGTQHERPAPKRAAPLPHEDTAAAVLRRDGRLLLVRRPARSRLGGMWSFPLAVRRPGEPIGETAVRALREEASVDARDVREIGAVKHTFTHVRATYTAIYCEATDEGAAPESGDGVAWASQEDLSRLALPVAQRRVAALALAAETTPPTGSPGAVRDRL